MKTSYFGSRKFKEGMNLVRISTSAPDWFPWPLRSFPKLYPGWELLKRYKEGQDNQEEARVLYHSQVLSKLDPKEVWEELGEDAVLLCWEKTDSFCHRHLVAEWLEENLGVKIEELQ